MNTLGFINQVSIHPTATMQSTWSIQEFYPDAPFVFSVDGRENYHHYKNMPVMLANSEWLFNEKSLGYPPYTKEKVLEWFKRIYICALKLNTSHFMLVEDDILMLNTIDIQDDWECVGHVIPHGNKIPEIVLVEIEDMTGVAIETDYYGNGGGSIYKTSTYLDNYRRVTEYLDGRWWFYKEQYYPECGYIDCFMALYFLLCGVPYTPNTRMLNIDPHTEEGRHESRNIPVKQLAEKYKLDYDLLHNVKYYYR